MYFYIALSADQSPGGCKGLASGYGYTAICAAVGIHPDCRLLHYSQIRLLETTFFGRLNATSMKQSTLQKLFKELDPLNTEELSHVKGGYRAAPTAIVERVSPRWDEIDIRLHNDDSGIKMTRPLMDVKRP